MLFYFWFHSNWSQLIFATKYLTVLFSGLIQTSHSFPVDFAWAMYVLISLCLDFLISQLFHFLSCFVFILNDFQCLTYLWLETFQNQMKCFPALYRTRTWEKPKCASLISIFFLGGSMKGNCCLTKKLWRSPYPQYLWVWPYLVIWPFQR